MDLPPIQRVRKLHSFWTDLWQTFTMQQDNLLLFYAFEGSQSWADPIG